jgi:hypothetical protein
MKPKLKRVAIEECFEPMTLLTALEKYLLRWGADEGREGFRMHICRARSLRSRIELAPKD